MLQIISNCIILLYIVPLATVYLLNTNAEKASGLKFSCKIFAKLQETYLNRQSTTKTKRSCHKRNFSRITFQTESMPNDLAEYLKEKLGRIKGMKINTNHHGAK